MSHLNKIDKEKIPTHVAIIMDGNGRWATKRGEQRSVGHKKGADTVRSIVNAAAEIGIRYLTLYTFSTENWSRPKSEVKTLMSLFVSFCKSETEKLHHKNIRLQIIGDFNQLPYTLQKTIKSAIKITYYNTGMTLILALSYGARQDITYATKKICIDVKQGVISPSDLSEELFRKYLSTENLPYPALLIRPGGERRISNFLLWEIADSELHFAETLWPDFDKEFLYKAIVEYQQKVRILDSIKI